jgi:cold shock CspA family protein
VQGTIASLQPDRGFGFVTANGEEVFFHRSDPLGVDLEELAEGLTIEFQPHWGRARRRTRRRAARRLGPTGGLRDAGGRQRALPPQKTA